MRLFLLYDQGLFKKCLYLYKTRLLSVDTFTQGYVYSSAHPIWSVCVDAGNGFRYLPWGDKPWDTEQWRGFPIHLCHIYVYVYMRPCTQNLPVMTSLINLCEKQIELKRFVIGIHQRSLSFARQELERRGLDFSHLWDESVIQFWSNELINQDVKHDKGFIYIYIYIYIYWRSASFTLHTLAY